MSDSEKKIPLNRIHRVLMLLLHYCSNFLFFLSMIIFTHFLSIPLPVPFAVPSMASISKTSKSNHLLNLSLYLLFWLQHMGMSTLKYKKTLVKTFGPSAALYERYIYNTLSSITLIVVIYFAQLGGDVLVELPFGTYSLALTGIVVFVWALRSLPTSLL